MPYTFAKNVDTVATLAVAVGFLGAVVRTL